MKNYRVPAVILLLLALCGCGRTPRTDPVLFCEAFNASAHGMTIREENVFRRSDTELLLYTSDLLIRLQTLPDCTVHSVTLTANAAQADRLRSAAECAFAILAEPFSEPVPVDFLQTLNREEIAVHQTETDHFLYLCFNSGQSITVLQWNRQLCQIPSLPALHPSGTE